MASIIPLCVLVGISIGNIASLAVGAIFKINYGLSLLMCNVAGSCIGLAVGSIILAIAGNKQ